MPNITILENGLTVITQKRDFKNITIGAWVKAGLLTERTDNNGISHFLEHMAFKGTENYNAQELVDMIEKLGGNCNAYTSVDSTAYHVSLLPQYWKEGVDFLSEILQYSTFPEDELEKERNVILQEIARSKDNPNSCLFKNILHNTYPNSILSSTILGPETNIVRIKREDLIDYMKTWYSFDNTIISACGDIDHESFVTYVKEKFTSLSQSCPIKTETPWFTPHYAEVMDKFDQTHVFVGVNGPKVDDLDYTTYCIFSNILDGGMSCRLFQEVREKRGLAYAVSLTELNAKTHGLFGIYAGVSNDKIAETIEVCKEVLNSMKTDISDEDFEKAKNLALFRLASHQDDCYTLTSSNAYDYMYEDKVFTYDELKKRIEAITKENVFEFASKYINNEYAIDILKGIEE